MDPTQPLLNIFLAVSTAYFFFILYLLRHKNPVGHFPSKWPDVCILVPFRNEQENIGACCDALINLNYPHDKLEIILLNDASSDKSVPLARNKTADIAHIKIVDITEEKNNLKAKMNVIAQGISITSAEYIFVTDADCQPSADWLKNTIAHFDDKTALISGFTILDEKVLTLFGLLQKLDWVYLQGLAFYSALINKPFTIIGNNLAFKRAVYNEMGGYENIGFSITEDHALMQAILTKTTSSIKYIRDENAIVTSKPLKSPEDFIKQRMRWIKGGLSGRLYAYVLIGSTLSMHIIILYILFSGMWTPFTAAIIGMSAGIEYLFIKTNLKALNLSGLKKYFWLYEMFYWFYPIVLIVLLPFHRTITWKDRKL